MDESCCAGVNNNDPKFLKVEAANKGGAKVAQGTVSGNV